MELTWVMVPIPKRATRTPATAKKIASGRHFSPSREECSTWDHRRYDRCHPWSDNEWLRALLHTWSPFQRRLPSTSKRGHLGHLSESLSLPPTIFPVPTVAARAVARAPKLEISPCPSSSVKIKRKAFGR